MKICITSRGDTLDSEIDPRFGRCAYFVFVNTETLAYEAISNPHAEATGGAGIQSGQLMVSKQIKTVITGNVGPNAFQTLEAAGIDVITGVSGSIKEAVEKYMKNEMKPTQGPSVSSKYGLGQKNGDML